jgi:hypothetical protein
MCPLVQPFRPRLMPNRRLPSSSFPFRVLSCFISYRVFLDRSILKIRILELINKVLGEIPAGDKLQSTALIEGFPQVLDWKDVISSRPSFVSIVLGLKDIDLVTSVVCEFFCFRLLAVDFHLGNNLRESCWTGQMIIEARVLCSFSDSCSRLRSFFSCSLEGEVTVNQIV